MLRTFGCLLSTLVLALACTSSPSGAPEPAEPEPSEPSEPAEPAPSGAPCTEEVIEPVVLKELPEASRGLAQITELHCAEGFAKLNVGGEGLDTALVVLRDEAGAWKSLYLGTGLTPKEWCLQNEDKLTREQCKALMRP